MLDRRNFVKSAALFVGLVFPKLALGGPQPSWLKLDAIYIPINSAEGTFIPKILVKASFSKLPLGLTEVDFRREYEGTMLLAAETEARRLGFNTEGHTAVIGGNSQLFRSKWVDEDGRTIVMTAD